MKFKKILRILFYVACVICFSSCGNSGTSVNENNNTISFWYGGSVVGEDEIEESQETWTVPTLLRKYESQTGIKINDTYFDDEEAMVQLIANNARVGLETPDVACIYSSEWLRDMADVTIPLNEYITSEEKGNLLFWETVTDDGQSITDSNTVYGYPFGGTEVTFIAYNKAIFNSVGVDAENAPPTTFDDFYNLCKLLYDHGITPIVASDDGWNELYLQVFAKRWVQFTGDGLIIEESKGMRNFSDDIHLAASLEMANDYYENGFINKDYATNADATTMFINGQGAMFSCSNYDVKMFQAAMGDNFGVFPLPDYSEGTIYRNISFGGCNQCLSMFNTTNTDASIALIHWLSNKENNIVMSKNFGCFPNRSDIELNEYNDNPDDVIQKIFPLLPYAHSTPDYLMPAKVNGEFCKYSTESLIGQLQIESLLEIMDGIT